MRRTVLLLDARTHETTARFSGHENTVFKAAFSPDSRLLASCSRDHTVRLWQIDRRVKVGARLHPPLSTLHPARCCAATPMRSSPSPSTPTARAWPRPAATGRSGCGTWRGARTVVRLPGHKSYVWSLAFSPDGATLASGSGDSTVRLWDTAPLKTRYQARREAAALRPEAERLVEQLWREKNDPAEVVEALRADRVPSEALRHAALRAVLRRAQPPEAAPGKPHDPP